jgi:hypothetical protein
MLFTDFLRYTSCVFGLITLKKVLYIAEISSSFLIFFNKNSKNLAILLFSALLFLISSCAFFALAESH